MTVAFFYSVSILILLEIYLAYFHIHVMGLVMLNLPCFLSNETFVGSHRYALCSILMFASSPGRFQSKNLFIGAGHVEVCEALWEISH